MNAARKSPCSLAVVFGVGSLLAGAMAAQRPPQVQIRSEATSFTEKLGTFVPRHLTFVDAMRKQVEIGEYFTGKRPVILNLGYYGCPMLCGVVRTGLVDGLKRLSMDPGKEFEVVTVSIDPEEKAELAREKKNNVLMEYARSGGEDHWHFLTGDEKQIHELADAVGFGYEWSPHGKQYDHPAGLILLSPEGKVVRYLYGAYFSPRDLRFGLVEASEGKVGSTWTKILLSCYGYDPKTRGYSLMIMSVVRIGGLLTLLGIGLLIFFLWRRERRKNVVVPATP